jgi:hypothetical protein
MLKKILSMLLVVMMVLSLGAITALATEPGPAETTPAETEEMPFFDDGLETDPPGKVQADGKASVEGNIVKIGKTLKLLNENTTHPAETFYLIQVESDVRDSSLDTAPDLVAITDAGYTGTGRLVGKVSFTEGEVTTTTGTRKDVEIELPVYEAVGVYTYILKEVDGKTAGMIYWENPIMLVITVMTNDEDGEDYYVAGVHCEELVADTPEDEQPAKSDNFENIYKANSFDPATGGIRIGKTVTGNIGDRQMYFDFTIVFTAEAGVNYSTAPLVPVSGGSHASNPTELDFTGLSDENPTMSVTFKLKNGENVAFGNVPYGVSYQYEEADYTSDGYTTTYPQIDSGEVDEETDEPVMVDDTEGVVDEVSKEYIVINDKNKPIDTGILLDNLPYVMALALVVIAGAAFVLGNRRNSTFA